MQALKATRTESPDLSSFRSPSHEDEDYSPVPATVMSTSSSPASASDFGFSHVQLPDSGVPTSSLPTTTLRPLGQNGLGKSHFAPVLDPLRPNSAADDANSSSGSMPSFVNAPSREESVTSPDNLHVHFQDSAQDHEEDSHTEDGPTSGVGTGKRRQKRLERNRESARLSRRRRKQYLEVLEENVHKLSQELDEGRRKHVSRAVWTIHSKRVELLAGAGKENNVHSLGHLEGTLSRTSPELTVVNAFQWQQLKSLALPPSTKFTFWLSLQNEEFYRGGRANSERLSAARIGERMLSSGTNQVTPSQNMWPLFCNEVGLSYEQEEKVRNYQRILLQTQESWLHRHTAFASEKTMDSFHEAVRAVTQRLGQREQRAKSILSDKQRMNLAVWATRNRDSLRAKTSGLPVTLPESARSKFGISPSQHVSANLYSQNDQFVRLLNVIPNAPQMIGHEALKKLSRRPLFESLGCCTGKDGDEGMSRDKSFSSTGSLKRSMQEMSMDGDDRPQVPSVSPEEAQAAAAALVERNLGQLREIIPESPTPSVLSVGQANIVIPAPTPVASMANTSNIPTSASFPPHDPHPGAPDAKHARKSSFLPAHLNVVPEEMWPGETAEDILMNLVDEDWAIGEEFF